MNLKIKLTPEDITDIFRNSFLTKAVLKEYNDYIRDKDSVILYKDQQNIIKPQIFDEYFELVKDDTNEKYKNNIFENKRWTIKFCILKKDFLGLEKGTYVFVNTNLFELVFFDNNELFIEIQYIKNKPTDFEFAKEKWEKYYYNIRDLTISSTQDMYINKKVKLYIEDTLCVKRVLHFSKTHESINNLHKNNY